MRTSRNNRNYQSNRWKNHQLSSPNLINDNNIVSSRFRIRYKIIIIILYNMLAQNHDVFQMYNIVHFTRFLGVIFFSFFRNCKYFIRVKKNTIRRYPLLINKSIEKYYCLTMPTAYIVYLLSVPIILPRFNSSRHTKRYLNYGLV